MHIEYDTAVLDTQTKMQLQSNSTHNTQCMHQCKACSHLTLKDTTDDAVIHDVIFHCHHHMTGLPDSFCWGILFFRGSFLAKCILLMTFCTRYERWIISSTYCIMQVAFFFIIAIHTPYNFLQARLASSGHNKPKTTNGRKLLLTAHSLPELASQLWTKRSQPK